MYSIGNSSKNVFAAYYNMGLNNFYKTIVHVFNVVGIELTFSYDDPTNADGPLLFNDARMHILMQKMADLYKGGMDEEKFCKEIKACIYCSVEQRASLDDAMKGFKESIRLTDEQKIRFRQLLFRHFPMLGPVMADETERYVKKDKRDKKTTKKSNIEDSYEELLDVTLDQCLLQLANFYQCMVHYRNYFSHYKSSLKTGKEEHTLAIKLDKMITASRRIDKKKRNTTIEYEFLTGSKHYDKVGNSFVENEHFYFNPKTKIGEKEVKKGEEIIMVPVFNLSDFGKVFLCTLFLSKKYAKMFQDAAGLFFDNGFTPEENEVMSELMSVYRIRVPRGRSLDSKSTKTTLGMDMLSELRKCPPELYEVMSSEGQRFFEVESEDKKVGCDDEAVPKSANEKVLMKRFVDRFPELALQYIDEKKLFEQIRFHIRLGSYRFEFYQKKCVDGDKHLRRIQKEVNGFGRLQDIETKRKSVWKNVLQKSEYREVKLENEDVYLDLLQFPKDNVNSEPYILDSRAQYNIHNNRIGLYWNRKDDQKAVLGSDELLYLPELNVVEKDDKKKAPLMMPAPLCSLSVFELPALLFYQYLYDKHGKNGKKYDSAEVLIIQKYKELVSLFTDIRNGHLTPSDFSKALLKEKYNLQVSDIPEKIAQWLCPKKKFQGQCDESEECSPKQRLVNLTKQHLKALCEDLQARLKRYDDDRKRIGGKDNKYGKNSYADVRDGTLAARLTKDIVKWQPMNESGKKMTGRNVNVMQAFLAFYGRQKIGIAVNREKTAVVLLERMFREAKLIGNEVKVYDHPFLEKVVKRNPRNIEELYKVYLEEEIKKLEELLDMELDTNTIRQIPFVHLDRKRYDDRDDAAIRRLAARYLKVADRDSNDNTVEHEATLLLPDGMFVESIRDILKKEYADNPQLMAALPEGGAEDNSDGNAAYHITKYFETVLADQCQPFYRPKDYEDRFARNYSLFSLLEDRWEGNTLLPWPMTPDQVLEELKRKTENPKYGKAIREEIDNFVETWFEDEIEWRKKKALQKNNKKDNRCNVLSPKQLEKLRSGAVNEAKKLHERLCKALKDCQKSEKTIRRYKTQDMILFLMAKDLLGESVGRDNDPLFKLKNVCEERFLRQAMDYTFVVEIDGREVSVVQPKMSIKNFGAFYHLLDDERFIALLKGFPEVKRWYYNKLMSELTYYDHIRPRIFEIMNGIEEYVYKKMCHGDIDGNSFSAVLALVGNETLGERERSVLVKIRNAFSHNHFRVPIEECVGPDTVKEYEQWVAKEETGGEKQHPLITYHVYKYAWDKQQQINNK